MSMEMAVGFKNATSLVDYSAQELSFFINRKGNRDRIREAIEQDCLNIDV